LRAYHLTDAAACLSVSTRQDIGIAAGMETMSQVKMAWEGGMNPKVFVNKQAKDCLLPMGITSENVAARYGVSRKEQDGQSDSLR